MTELLNRVDLIEDLMKFGSDNDQEILDAARKIHAIVNSSGLGWEELLVSENIDDEDEGELEMPDHQGISEQSESNGDQSGRNDESIKLIDKLLSIPNSSSELKTELMGYKEDIKVGEFDDPDRQYIRALFKRLKS